MLLTIQHLADLLDPYDQVYLIDLNDVLEEVPKMMIKVNENKFRFIQYLNDY